MDRLEFARVTAAIATLAESDAGRARASGLRPIADRDARALEAGRVVEAVRRSAEPGAWLWTGPGDLGARLDAAAADGAAEALDGPGLVAVRAWLDAAAETRAAWRAADAVARHAMLAALAEALPDLEALRAQLTRALEADGRISDRASDTLARARRGLVEGERRLMDRMERWARPFGSDAFVTRFGDRMVAMVPAAGFARRRGIVHDVSGSGQSVLVEPIELCDDNNRVIALRATVEEEERRILRLLAGAVLESAAGLRESEAVLAHLDTLRARARWAAAHGGVVVLPGGERLRLARARHPVLAMGAAADRLVPLDLSLDRDHRLVLVSGPNMGGKTVLLKTVGLTVLLAHAACPVLAEEGSAVPEVSTVIADIGDEQSLDRGLSTFAAHLATLAEMTAAAGADALLLCDELGAGTDPEEGTALGRALIERFAERRAWGVVTTHLGGLKTLAEEVPGVMNGSLAFDGERMAPCYRFLPDIPGASHALSMAERLGFDPDVIARARALTPDTTAAIEALIGRLERAHREAVEAREVHEAAAARAAAAEATHQEAATEARREARELRRRLTRESDILLGQARELVRRMEREARRGRREDAAGAGEALRALEGARTRLEEEVSRAAGPEEADAGLVRLAAGEAVPGTRVRVLDLDVEAEIVAGPDGDGTVTLKRGAWRITSRVDRLARLTAAPAKVERAPAVAWEAVEAAPVEVDLRGMEVDEALRTLDQHLDRAVVGGLSELRIIHGVGRGVLRAAVERHLGGHPQVTKQRMGQFGEGGRGVTVASLA